MMRLEYNSSSTSFDVPSLAALPAEKWGNGLAEEGRWWNLTGVVQIYDVGYGSIVLSVDLASMLDFYADHGLDHDGIITLGDHNRGIYDQMTDICREPVRDEWIIGEAKAEIPWLGIVKLWVNGNLPENTPDNSKSGLIAVVVLLIAVPLAFDISSMVLSRKGIDPWARLKERLRRKRD